MDSQENRNNRIGLFTSLGIHAAVFLMLFFIMAWRAPNPPLAEYGVELNFGLDDQGSGEVQPLTPVGEESTEQSDQLKQSESKQEEIINEGKDESAKDVPKVSEEAISKSEGDVKENKEKKEVKETVVKDKTNDPKKQEKVIAEYKKEEKKINPNDESKKGELGNQGDDKNKTGDKGKPEGKLDPNAQYVGQKGGGGGGDGTGLQMDGWTWAKEFEKPEIPDNENGKVVFEIECDATGEIIGIKTEERTLSPKAEQMLKEAIRNNSLIRISGGQPPARSKGKFVFTLKNQ